MMTLKIEKTASDGKGIARGQGGVIFVAGALPDELVEADIVLQKREYAVARATKIIEPTPKRTLPECPYFCADKKCGGCQLQHANYELQLEIKASFVADALTRIGKFSPQELPGKITCVPSPQIWNYRNKASFPVQNATLGFYSERSHSLVEIETCRIIDERLNFIFKKIRSALPDFGLGGLLRHVVLKTCGENSLVSFVVGGKLNDAQRKKIISFARTIPNSTFTLNENSASGNVILGRKTEILTGIGYLEANVCGNKIRYDTTSFFQVNARQAEQIYAHVCSLVPRDANVLELYAGVGSMTLCLAKHAQNITAIEEWKPAVALMRKNIEINGIRNVRAICKKIPPLEIEERYDVVVLDPPRGGCEDQVIAEIASSGIARIVYVSCNPATLARDLRKFADAGYKIETLEAFDMFPQTTHVEVVAGLVK